MKPKKECPKCKRLLRTAGFIYNKKIGEELCKRCDKRVGSNIFFDPSWKHKSISKYSITADEKKVLAKQKGWTRANHTEEGLRLVQSLIKTKRKKDAINSKEKENKNKELNKKFLEGLGQTQ